MGGGRSRAATLLVLWSVLTGCILGGSVGGPQSLFWGAFTVLGAFTALPENRRRSEPSPVARTNHITRKGFGEAAPQQHR